jgi:integrase
MAGQIINRGNDTWVVRIFKGRDAQGKRLYMNKTIKGKKKDAETYLSKTLMSISTGTFTEPSPMTVDEYLNKWLSTVAQRRVTERTFTSYQYLLKTYVRPIIGDKRLSDLRPLDIQSLYNRMASPKLKEKEEPKSGITYGLGLSARSVRYTHSVLSSAFKQAVRWNMLARNPGDAVELPRLARREMLAFSPEEAARFLKAAAEDAYATLFAFALTTGM